MPEFIVKRLKWEDAELARIEVGGHTLPIVASFGSGLTRRAGDPPGIVWALGDRGPNIKPKVLVERYGVTSMDLLTSIPGAKIMPRVDIGPRMAKLRVTEDAVELVSEHCIRGAGAEPVTGLPPASSEHAKAEPVFDLAGAPLPPDPAGLDSEGIAALASGGFWVSDEFGPSLVRLDEAGRILARYVPHGCDAGAPGETVHAILPAIAATRQLNRGFEGLALSRDERALFVAFQSPLAHPDEAAHQRARHVRICRLDAATLEVTGQYLYPLDEPASFRRDNAKERVKCSDLKVSELVALGPDELLVLERGSETAKIYQVTLTSERALPGSHLEPATRPTVEQLSADRAPLPELAKKLVLSTDDLPELAADLEGMAILSPCELLLVSDNDFGVEGARTSFALVVFDAPRFACADVSDGAGR